MGLREGGRFASDRGLEGGDIRLGLSLLWLCWSCCRCSVPSVGFFPSCLKIRSRSVFSSPAVFAVFRIHRSTLDLDFIATLKHCRSHCHYRISIRYVQKHFMPACWLQPCFASVCRSRPNQTRPHHPSPSAAPSLIVESQCRAELDPNLGTHFHGAHLPGPSLFPGDGLACAMHRWPRARSLGPALAGRPGRQRTILFFESCPDQSPTTFQF